MKIIKTLRDYQEQDVAWLLTRDSSGIFSEQRTGKTPTAITTMARKNVKRLLIVCPASILYKWKLEVEEWSDMPCIIAEKHKKRFLNVLPTFNGAIVVNYEALRNTAAYKGMIELFTKWKPDGIIVDEAHRLQGRGTYTYKSIMAFTKVKHRLALTGTPAPNNPWDIWSILHFVDPKGYSSYWRFIEEYFYTTYNRYADKNAPSCIRPDKAMELQQQINNLSVMRKRKDTMEWLPKEPIPIRIKLTPTPTQRRYLQELKDTFETDHIITQGILDMLIRTRQICAHPKILALKGSSPKLDWLIQYEKDYPNKSKIVFSNSTKFLKILKDEYDKQGYHSRLLCGETPHDVRQKYINNFQGKRFNTFFIQTQAGKEGLTLDKADVTIFLDVYPPAADYLQAKDRMIPTTEDAVKAQEIIHVMMHDTYDEQLYALVHTNINRTDVINNYTDYMKERS